MTRARDMASARVVGRSILHAAALLAALATAVPAAAAPPPGEVRPGQGVRRFALVVGANKGGGDRVTLRFAGSDARAFSRVLRELGGAAADDLEVLVDPSLAAVETGFARLRGRMDEARARGSRVELIVYYSGHSDEEGLLLSGRKLTYSDLRRQISDMPADVNIAILDSCASGAFTRTKGGRRLPAFLVDESHEVHGHAFLSSSSADEQAQESDLLGGSFFTHAFVGGLRGAADTNRDGRVTLNEAYQFAFNETVSRTQNTRFGAQHPNYEMHLVGSGDVILTDLRGTGASVVLSAEMSGRVYVRDRARALVLELNKVAGAPVVLGLPPDTYDITLASGDKRSGTQVTVAQGQRVTLAVSDLQHLDMVASVARGGPPGAQPDWSGYSTSPLHFDLWHVPGKDERSRHFVSLNLLVGGGAVLEGFEMGALVNMRSERATGTQLAGIGNFSGGPAGLQIAGITNWTVGRAAIGQIAGVINSSAGASGFQLAGVANVSRGPSPGVQVAGVANLQSGGDSGLQIAGVLNMTSDRPRFGQISGAGGWAGGGIDGFQLSGLASLSGRDMRGVQIAGATNHVRGDMRGVQLAGLYNQVAGNVQGTQVAVLNVGGEVEGAQVGVVNVARRIDGLQLGLVNVATESNANGAPVGLLSVAPDARWSLEGWIADVIPGRLGLKLGSQHLYTLLAVGGSKDYLTAGAGLGAHMPGRSFYVDIDAAMYQVAEHDFDEPDGVDAMVEARAMVGIPLDLGFAVFAGVSSTGVMSWDKEHPARDLSFLMTSDVGGGGDDFTMKISPGLFAGIAY
ncbi:MAG TPA: caspase family protein [Kofleriaceae bacterium]|nr:caspase family protein [Kofleriaceae bacterium]